MCKTRIVYASGMNFEIIKPYLALLIENGLIETLEDYPVSYKTTQKGERALECFREIEKLMPSIKKKNE
jgi:predicted transcriptional regulator